MNLGYNAKVTRVMNAVAAGQTAQNSSILDMSGFEGVVFVAAFGAISSNAVTSIKAQQGMAADMSDAADLAGTSISIPDSASNKLAVLDVYRPRERYVRLVISRGTANAAIDGVVAIQYGRKEGPIAHDADTVVGSEVHASPGEGTA